MIGWAVETLIASTLLMLLVLALRAPTRRAFGPSVAYALWLLPALRMALPPLPSPLRLVETSPIGAPIPPGTLMLMQPVATIPAVPQGWGMADVPGLAVLFWFAGAAFFFCWHVVRHAQFCRRVLASGRGYDVAQGKVRVFETDAASGPLAFGRGAATSLSPATSPNATTTRSARSRLRMSWATTPAVTCWRTGSRSRCSPATGSIRSPGAPFVPFAPTRRWPAMRWSSPAPAQASATPMVARS